MSKIYDGTDSQQSLDSSLRNKTFLENTILPLLFPPAPDTSSFLTQTDEGKFAWTPATGENGAVSLSQAKILIGDSANIPQPKQLSGDVSLLSSGVVSINVDTITPNKLVNSGVTAGTYTAPTVTVDSKGLITTAESITNFVKKVPTNSTNRTIPVLIGTDSLIVTGTQVVIDESNRLIAPSTEQAMDTDSGSLRTMGGLAVKKDIRSDGDIHCYNVITFSDEKLKDGVVKLDTNLPLENYRFYEYHLKKDSDKRKQYGVIAQQLQELNPELVYTDTNNTLAVDYRSLHSLLINDLLLKYQQLLKEVENLKK